MIHVHAEVVKSLKTVAENNIEMIQCFEKSIFGFLKVYFIKKKKVVNAVVELDQMKLELASYESPLAEVRDSL